MFVQTATFICLLIAVCHAQKSIPPSILMDIFGTTARNVAPSKNDTNPSPTPNKTSQTNDVIDDKVETIIDRIFGSNATTEKAPGEVPSSDSSSDLDTIIDQIFNNNVSTTTVEPPANLEPTKCKTSKGEGGVCVLYYMCVNDTIIADGKYQVDIKRKRSIPDHVLSRRKRLVGGEDDQECPSYLEVCCLLKDQNGNPITEKPDIKGVGCGWRNPKGVDDQLETEVNEYTSKFGEFPWMCAIIKIELVPDPETGGQKIGDVYVGGGSLIHPSVVLTAAHYVFSASRLRVRAGAWDVLQANKALFPYQLREVYNIDMHKDFNKENLFYDVALLYLSAPMVSAPNVGVVCLPPPRDHVPRGTRCFATGWGKDKYGRDGKYQVVLKKVDVPVVGNAACEKQLRKTRLGRYFQLHSSFMCAGGEEDKDTCKGDGGSPLSCPIETDENRFVQSGIVAWGIGCGQPGIPSVYVDVSNVRPWIDERVIKRGFDPKTYTI